jgi:ABC-type ATPase involved in cell division
MILLELEHVCKRFRRGSCVALDDISLAIEPGELVTVWGERRSGRSTLLRVAAGIEPPDSGIVRFQGRDLAGGGSPVVGCGVSFCRRSFRLLAGESVLDQIVSAQFARRVPRSLALARALHALRRVDAEQCASLTPQELGAEETTRVAIARGLTSQPQLMVIDEPTLGTGADERDRLLGLLRSLADEGLSVLMSTGEGTGVLGADRVLSLDKGRLRGSLAPELAPVTHLTQRRQQSA